MMAIRNSKKIKELEEENEELKSFFRKIYEKEDTIRHLKVVLENIRTEIAELKDEKAKLSLSIDNLKIDLHNYNTTKNEINNEIENLKRNKVEEQNKLFKLRAQLNQFEIKLKDINTRPEVYTEKITKEITDADKKRKELQTTNKTLEENISKLNNRLHLLYEQEKEITDKINTKKNELEQLPVSDPEHNETNVKIIEDKIKTLQEAESKITAEMKDRINKLKEEETSVKEAIEQKMRELKTTDTAASKEKSVEVKATEDKLLSLIV